MSHGGAWLLASLATLAVGALFSLLFGFRSRRAAGVAFASCLISALLALPPTASALADGKPWQARLSWAMPIGTLQIGLDSLSAFFLLFVLLLAVPAAAYGKGYLSHDEESRWASTSWCFFQLLVASMALVVLARDGVLFLLAWEGMSVSSFFLVLFHHEDEGVRKDGLVYLTATHLGAACLAALFGLWGAHAGTLAFDGLASTPLAPGVAWAVFLLGLAGFGSKAGLIPFHVWLPRAHPAAPSHVSALMSGVMIKMGLYGILRLLLLAGTPPRGWGYLLMGFGAASALGGVAYALAQQDLKRLLAYSSVENVGIIFLGLGAALVARATGLQEASLLAAAGALLHTLNHALFKGLLFMSGGAAAQATGTRNMEKLGGLLRRMPVTGAAFLAGSAAICALPPLNGFVSEWLLYAGFLKGALRGVGAPSAVLFAAVPSLALVGGLALACFAKASGVVFLGEPRSPQALRVQERGLWMRVPMAAVGAGCLAVGLGAPWALRLVLPAAQALVGGPDTATQELASTLRPLQAVAWAGLALLAASAFLLALRNLLLRGRELAKGPTWGCGFVAPSPRMQYTASSFAQPLLAVALRLVPAVRRQRRAKGLFPHSASYQSRYPDPADRWIFDPVVRGILAAAKVLRPLQHGKLQNYLLYVLVALVALLLWQVLT